MKRISLGLSALALVVAGAGYAAQDHGATRPSETRAEAQLRAGKLFDRLDLNHDGKLDQADRLLRINQQFDQLDTNHDGAISRDEFAAALASGPDHDGPNPDADHDHDHAGHWGYDHRELGGLVALIIQRADPGHSGTITRDGFVNAALALFDQADTNHDGVLTPEEHRAAAQAARQQFGEHGAGHAGWHHHGDGDLPPPSPGT